MGRSLLLRPSLGGLFAAASLGRAQTMAGATQLVASSGTASGISLPANTAVQIGYSVIGTATPAASWTIGGTVPPGLILSDGQGSPGLTGPGVINTANGVLVLAGTPTEPGAYHLTFEAWEGPNATEVNSPVFSYEVTVTASGGGAPVFTTQPQNETATIGQAVTFTAAASGSPSYQWQFNGLPIPGATGPSLTLANLQLASAGTYSVAASNGNGTTESDNAVLTLNNAPNGPVFTLQPLPQSVAEGSTVVFSAAAGGSPAPSYQWYLTTPATANAPGSGIPVAIPGATSPTLVVSATPAFAGLYDCVASNSGGVTTSNQANLTVYAGITDPGHLVNLSILSDVVGSLSMGFVLGGAGTGGNDLLLIRGVGPAIGPGTPFNVPGVMADPTLSVTQGNVTVAGNSGWGSPAGNAAAVEAADVATGAFPLTNTASLDSALVFSFAPGNYAATVAGNSGDNGFALTEVYDATANYTLASTRLVNLSCLTQIAPGGSLDVGFVIGGTTGRTILVRAGGPALAGFGITSGMVDPRLQVSPLVSAGNLLAFNAGWGGNPEIASIAASVGAYAFTPSSLDSAAVLTLSPGAYTVEVNSASGAGGTVLVELYEVP